MLFKLRNDGLRKDDTQISPLPRICKVGGLFAHITEKGKAGCCRFREATAKITDASIVYERVDAINKPAVFPALLSVVKRQVPRVFKGLRIGCKNERFSTPPSRTVKPLKFQGRIPRLLISGDFLLMWG
nr:MAG TPA: hypothetical protein [Caudoviricetes sp.]